MGDGGGVSKRSSKKISHTQAPFYMTPCEAIQFFVSDRFGPVAGKPHISVIPNASVDDFYLSLAHFDYSPGAKNGCPGR